ncbi:hypothetical protein ACWD9X_42130 [Streptomyces sp. NPDC005075]
MSFEAVLWATNDAPIANVNEFAVLTMLAEKADPDGCNAFPSRPTIAARTTVDPKTVLRALQAMEARGLIAQGEQRAADYIRADRRPVVYDLLIPYSWFPNIDRINKERQERGRRPLTRSTRPDIAPAPEKKQRSDKGKPRAKNQAADQHESLRGDFESPRDSDGYGVTLSPARGDSQSATGGLQVTRTSPVTLSTTSNNSVLPSVCDVQVPDAPGSVMAGWTDGGGGVIGDEEQRPMAAGGVDTAADAAPESGSSRARGASLGPVLVAWVEMTPGVQVLRAVATEAPEWTITHAESLRDQGLVASGMLLEGFTPQEIRHALLSKPLPRPVRTTVAAVVGRRLRDLFAAGPAAGVRPIPVQQRSDGYDALGRPESHGGDEARVPPSWAEQRAQLESAVSGRDKHRPCAGDRDLCPNLALPGSDLCAVCQGGEKPRCADGCGRGVVVPGLLCLACAEQPATTESGDCPGYGSYPCGRAVQTAGLCGRCKIAAEEVKRAAEAEWEAARTGAVTAVEAAESAAAAHTVTV